MFNYPQTVILLIVAQVRLLIAEIYKRISGTPIRRYSADGRFLDQGRKFKENWRVVDLLYCIRPLSDQWENKHNK